MYAVSSVLHCDIPILLNRRENAHILEGQGEKEGYQVWFKNIGWYGMEQLCCYKVISDCFRTRTRQKRARVEVPGECVLLDVYSDASESYK